ncbi:acid protease [Russula decolorans]
MYFSTVVAFAALPFLVGAVPVSLNSPRTDRPMSVPLTKRSNHLNDDGSVNLEKLQAGIDHTMARFDRALSAYERNTGEPHPLALRRGRSNERRDFASVPLTDDMNLVWTGDIQVGTPPQTFPVVFDTFTPDMFIPGDACMNCDANSFYDTSTSSTGTNLNQVITASFGVGTVSGNIVSDNISVAGLEGTKMSFFVASSISPVFPFPAFPVGILGMGFALSSNLVNPQKNFFGTLGLEVIGLFLGESGPELIVGGTDSSKFSGNLTIIESDTENFWQINMDSISVNGADVSLSDLADPILDSGSTFVSGDSGAISNIYSNIPGSAPVSNSSSLFTIPCDSDVTITFTFGGTGFNIPPSAYNLGAVPGSTSGNDCMGGFATGPGNMLILGTVFLQNVYTNLDLENLQVGFAQTT